MHYTVKSASLFQLYCYERVVSVLLTLIRMLRHTAAMNHLRRIAMYLLNNMVCQVNGEQKTLVGHLDAIQVCVLVFAKSEKCLCFLMYCYV